jgi:hypothetical protein
MRLSLPSEFNLKRRQRWIPYLWVRNRFYELTSRPAICGRRGHPLTLVLASRDDQGVLRRCRCGLHQAHNSS